MYCSYCSLCWVNDILAGMSAGKPGKIADEYNALSVATGKLTVPPVTSSGALNQHRCHIFGGCSLPRVAVVPVAIGSSVDSDLFPFHGDLTVKAGRKSDLDHDRTNEAEDNLAWMCVLDRCEYD